MKVRGIVWVGTDTPHYEEMVRFARDLLGLRVVFEGQFEGDETVEFECPNGTRFQITRGSTASPPVPLFEVEDLFQAREELERAGIQILGTDETDGTWQWFGVRAPDGNTYTLAARLGRRASGDVS
jgi:catechol 2,3-dioxygenase-like lactoylglutathione lyase family enzyme